MQFRPPTTTRSPSVSACPRPARQGVHARHGAGGVGRGRWRARPRRVGPALRDGRAGDARARGGRRSGPRRTGPGAGARGRLAGPACPTRWSRRSPWPRRWRGTQAMRQTRQVPAPPACPTPTDSAWWRPISAARTWPAWPTPTGCCCASGCRHAPPRRPGRRLAHPVDTVHGARRAAIVDWQPAPETVVTDDPATVALALDRGAVRHGRPAHRARPPHARPDRRVREGRRSSACRSERSGGEAPPGRRPPGARLRTSRGASGANSLASGRRPPPARVDGEGEGRVRSGVAAAARRPSSATVPSATPSSRPAPLPSNTRLSQASSDKWEGVIAGVVPVPVARQRADRSPGRCAPCSDPDRRILNGAACRSRLPPRPRRVGKDGQRTEMRLSTPPSACSV